MTPSVSLKQKLFNTREPLYFNKDWQSQSSAAEYSSKFFRSYFKCGRVQAPRFGFRDIYLEDSKNALENDSRCSEVLSSLTGAMRDEVKNDPEKLKKFYHPDAEYKAGIFYRTVSSTASLIGYLLFNGHQQEVDGRVPENLEAACFSLDKTHLYKSQSNSSLSIRNSSDILCGEVRGIRGKRRTQIVYVSKEGEKLCPELLDFVAFNMSEQPYPSFPVFLKIFNLTEDKSTK